jgi:hypothetical protein
MKLVIHVFEERIIHIGLLTHKMFEMLTVVVYIIMS